MTSVTIQDFQQSVAAAAHVSELEPVILVENGEPQRVLIDIAEYRRIHPELYAPLQAKGGVLDLSVPDEEYFDWEPDPRHGPDEGLEQH